MHDKHTPMYYWGKMNLRDLKDENLYLNVNMIVLPLNGMLMVESWKKDPNEDY